MTLSSSLVGLWPGWDLPPALQHADLQPEETLAGSRRGTQLPAPPLPCNVLSFCSIACPGCPGLLGGECRCRHMFCSWIPPAQLCRGPGDRACCRACSGLPCCVLPAMGHCHGCGQPWSQPLMKCHQVLFPYSLNPQAGADPRSLVPALGLLQADAWEQPRAEGGKLRGQVKLEGSTVPKWLWRRSAGRDKSLQVPVTPSPLLSILW